MLTGVPDQTLAQHTPVIGGVANYLAAVGIARAELEVVQIGAIVELIVEIAP